MCNKLIFGYKYYIIVCSGRDASAVIRRSL